MGRPSPRSKNEVNATTSLASSLGNSSPAHALQLTIVFGSRRPKVTRFASFFSVVEDVLHSVLGSGIWGALEPEAMGTTEVLEAILMSAFLFIRMQCGEYGGEEGGGGCWLKQEDEAAAAWGVSGLIAQSDWL